MAKIANHWRSLVGGLLIAALSPPAYGEMILSKVIIDLQPDQPSYEDIEVWNDGADRIYVLAEVAEIIAPGLLEQRRVSVQDPTLSGLLVAPQRLVLEPGQRRVIRVSAVSPRRDSDRIYRVTIRPVGGPITASESALKVFVGYDTLVIFRPATIVGAVVARREGRQLILKNESNTAQEVFGGKQCDSNGKNCENLVSSRLYAGETLSQKVKYDSPIEYSIKNGQKSINVIY